MNFYHNVDAAHKFLTSADTRNASMEEKIRFLEKKGLSQEEISTAIDKVNGVSLLASPRGASHEPAQLSWKDWMVAAALVSSAGYYGYKTLCTFLGDYWPFTRTRATPDADSKDARSISEYSFVEALENESNIDAESLAHISSSVDTITESFSQLTSELQASKEQLCSSCENLDMALNLFQQNMSFVGGTVGCATVGKGTDVVKGISDEVEQIRKMVPKLIQRSLKGYELSLKDLQAELKSLRSLMSVNRTNSPGQPSPDLLTLKKDEGGTSTPKHELPAWQRS